MLLHIPFILVPGLIDYLSSNSLLNPHQSGFTKHHSTATLPVPLYNKLVSAVSHQQVPALPTCLSSTSLLQGRLSLYPGGADAPPPKLGGKGFLGPWGEELKI